MSEVREEIEKTQMEIYELTKKLAGLQAQAPVTPVSNYQFRDLNGEVSLRELFGEADTLFAIHNMGQACRYCTLWGDGLNGFLPHLEDRFAVVMLSKDAPELQRRFANGRNWRFRLASHGGGDYIREQTAMPGADNYPGVVCYQREGDEIFRKNSAVFGPGDLYCSIWNLLSLAGENEASWTPQYAYWDRPQEMEDGGENLR